MKTYDPNKIKDDWLYVSYKIDGVKGIKEGDIWLSRANKPLYNLPLDVPDGEYEIFLGDFKSSISACRTKEGKPISKEYLFALQIEPEGYPDKRLRMGLRPKSTIDLLFKKALKSGYEGLVIYSPTKMESYKLKSIITYDVKVVELQPGAGKHLGKMGAFIVELDGVQFKVGTGFTDEERVQYNTKDMIGKIIEIKGMELLPSGKIRHPVFVRLREDLK